MLPDVERLPAQVTRQLELANKRLALALPLRVMLAQAPAVTSTVSVTPLTVMESVESGCPPGPDPLVIALQFWLVLMVMAAACEETAPSDSSIAANNHATMRLFI